MMRPGPIVLDASVAISIARKEPEAASAVSSIAGWTRDGIAIVVPSHFWLEVANALTRRHRWAGDDVLQTIHDMDELSVETIDLDRASIVLTIDLSERHRLSAYDAAYLALAEFVDGSLLTFDAALRRAAGLRAIHLGPTRLSEARAPYEYPVTWPSYKGASAYLAKLRAEAARPG